jgi:hypothetical protein
MELLEVRDLKIDLAKLKKNLARGDQRRLAKSLKTHPNRVSYAFDGFVSDETFLSTLVAETQKLLKDRKPSDKKSMKGKTVK